MTEAAHRTGGLDKSLTIKEIMDTWTVQVSIQNDFQALKCCNTICLSALISLIFRLCKAKALTECRYQNCTLF